MLKNITLLGGFPFTKTTVLVGRVAAADYRSITALRGADKALEKSDRQCSSWWGFLQELILQVRNPHCHPFVYRMGGRILASNPSDILESFFRTAESSICFRMRIMWNTKKSSKQVDKCTKNSRANYNGYDYQSNLCIVSHRPFRQLEFCLSDRHIHQKKSKNRHKQPPIAEWEKAHFRSSISFVVVMVSLSTKILVVKVIQDQNCSS